MASLRSLFILLLLLLLSGNRPAPRPAVRWLTPQTLADSMRVRPKPVLVKIYTDWCHYCKLQDLTTFQDKNVANQLNTDFYAVALNAESQEPVQLAGRTFKFQPTGPSSGVHELAVALARDESGQVPYPTTVLLNDKLQVRGRWSGLIKAKQPTAALDKLRAETAAPR